MTPPCIWKKNSSSLNHIQSLKANKCEEIIEIENPPFVSFDVIIDSDKDHPKKLKQLCVQSTGYLHSAKISLHKLLIQMKKIYYYDRRSDVQHNQQVDKLRITDGGLA